MKIERKFKLKTEQTVSYVILTQPWHRGLAMVGPSTWNKSSAHHLHNSSSLQSASTSAPFCPMMSIMFHVVKVPLMGFSQTGAIKIAIFVFRGIYGFKPSLCKNSTTFIKSQKCIQMPQSSTQTHPSPKTLKISSVHIPTERHYKTIYNTIQLHFAATQCKCIL